ncbi:MAG: OB-fold nucleic acid binding domain-containing protein [Candidatus Micrarchaeia archaeon]
MKISDLKVGTSNVTIQGKVVNKEEPREVVTKYGKRLSVANITLQDETGSIAMSLWGNDIDMVNVGDVIEVSNGYVNEFRGTPQLSTGKFGKIRVVEKSGSSEELTNTEDEDRSGDLPEEDIPTDDIEDS